MWQLSYTKTASKELLGIPLQNRRAILRECNSLESLPHPASHRHVIKLSGHARDYRLRVGTYRVKFTVEPGNIIGITHIEHRQAGY